MAKHYKNPHVPTEGLPKLIDSAERVKQVLTVFRKVSSQPFTVIETICRQFQEALHLKRIFSMDAKSSFQYIGNAAIIELKGVDDDEMAALLQHKSNAYGDSPIESWGELGVIIRIDSKRLRYENLMNNNAVENDESKRDTMLDILGYAILGYRLVTRKDTHTKDLHQKWLDEQEKK